MAVSEQVQNVLLQAWTNHLVRNASPKVFASAIESDKRKQNKVLRGLIESGYLEVNDGIYHATMKCWDEIPTAPVPSTEIWEHSCKGWNRRNRLPIIRFDFLTWGQKKTVIMCAGYYQWFVMNAVSLNYDISLQDDDMSEAIHDPDSNLGQKIAAAEEMLVKKLVEQGRGGNFPQVEIVLKYDGLTNHVEKLMAEETFAALYSKNLKWGLSELEVASSEDAAVLMTSDANDFLGGSDNTNLGTDPDKWGEMLSLRIREMQESIARKTRDLQIMERIRKNIGTQGGWGLFLDRYKNKLIEELKNK